MISIGYILDRIQDVKLADYLAIFPMIAAWTIKPFFKSKYQNAWLICEEAAEARDNGYHFFKYMSANQPQQKCFYAIKKNSVDYKKVKVLGDIIEYGSIQHWLAYFLCEYNISSQKGGKPNAAVCAFIELGGWFKPQNVFLQHGVTINNVRWLYADRSKIDIFFTATTKETEFIKQNFGYPQNTIQLTGFPRFDNLHNPIINHGQIVFMPTWRYWFSLNSKKSPKIHSDIQTSNYVNKWVDLLSSYKFKKLIKMNNLKIVFYLHRNMQKYIDIFKKCSAENIIIASWEKYDIQELLLSSEMLVTDYSSVFFDMVYMKKPVVFYQFDKVEYRKYQYGKGYFDYENNPFGNSRETVDGLIDELDFIIQNKFGISEKYIDEHKSLFKFYDKKNSERIYKFLKDKQ